MQYIYIIKNKMSEELNQRDLIHNPEKIGKYDFRNIGSTSLLQLKKAGIIHNKSYTNFEKRKPDAIISIPEVVKSKVKTVLGIVENKSTSQFKTKKQKASALQQGLEVAQILEAKFVILTDTVDTIWVNAYNGEEILDEKGRPIKILFEPKNPDLENLIGKIIDSVDENNSQIREPRLMDPTDLAKRIWQILWSISGATPESCLYSFVELFIFKYLSDLGVLQNDESFDKLLQSYSYKSPEKVIDYYAKNIRLHIKNDLFPRGGDGTTIINGSVFVNNEDEAIEGRSTAFEKILREFEKYGKLENIHPDFKSKLFETFLKESLSEKKWGQYFTPLKVVQAIVQMAESDINENSIICDPAGGVGKFVLEAVKPRLNEFYKVEKRKLKHKIKLYGFDIGFDKDEQKTIILAKANMLIYFSELIRNNKEITKEFSTLFNETFELKKNSILGTLANKENEAYTLILSNPPYVTSGSSNIKAEIVRKNLQDHYKINAMGLEGLFMEWIIRALKPNGKAFIVVPDGIFNRQNDKNLRQFILDECIIDGIISLPIKTFFSTSKKTYILAITKKKDKAEKQTEPVFTYLVSEIGESRDIYRFDIEQDDLNNAVNLYNFFKGNKTGFEKINSDKRCKIQPIEKFEPETHWSIERWWTKEEQIELGIVEESNKTKFEEFPDIIEDVANNILSFKEEILLLKEKKKFKSQIKFLTINEICDSPSTNSGLKKIHVNLERKAEYNIPVYSATKEENLVFGWVEEKSKWKKYENMLTWNKDGSANYVFYRKEKFVPYEKVKLLKIKENSFFELSYEYLKIVIQERLLKEGFDFNRKCSMDRVLKLEIPIPFDEKDNIDIEKQQEIIEKYEYIGTLKSKILDYKKQIEELNVEVENNSKKELFSIDTLFDIKSGNSKLTQNYLNTHKGEYVVYSANTKQNGVFGYINSYDHDIECLQLTTNGVYAGTFFYREKHKFSINGDARLLIKKENNLDYYYLLNELKNVFTFFKFNWENKPTIEKIKPIEIPIPINSKGEFDLEAQKEIAEKYRKIEQIKKSISAELDKIATIEIDYE